MFHHYFQPYSDRMALYSKTGWFNAERLLNKLFSLAVRVYSENAHTTSNRGKNKEVRYEPRTSSVTDALATF